MKARELRDLDDRELAKRVVELRKGYPQQGLMINVIFHVPGPIHQPDYEGVHARRLDRKSGELLVHAAVPPTLRFDGVPNYVAEVLSQVRQEARDYLKERRINLSTAAVDSLIGTVIEELRSQ